MSMSVNFLEIPVGIEFSSVTSLSQNKVCSRKKYSKKTSTQTTTQLINHSWLKSRINDNHIHEIFLSTLFVVGAYDELNKNQNEIKYKD